MTDKENKLISSATALTGGIATGKSTVAGIFSGLGAAIIDTDRLAREVVEPGEPALERIIELFGSEYILPDGTLNREMMRNLIIKDPGKRENLNRITHPAIMGKVDELLVSYASKDIKPVIIDIPLLFETGWERFFRRIILVYTPASIQVERLIKRDGIARETAEITLKAQMPIEEKRLKSDFIIDNSGSLKKTEEQARKIFDKIAENKIPPRREKNDIPFPTD